MKLRDVIYHPTAQVGWMLGGLLSAMVFDRSPSALLGWFVALLWAMRNWESEKNEQRQIR